MKKMLKNKKGFTLVELMVVVAILGILVAVAIPVYKNVTTDAAKKACFANQRTIESAIMQYNIANPANPIDTADELTALLSNKAYLAEIPKCPTGGVYALEAGNLTVICNAGAEGSVAHGHHVSD